MNDKRRGGYAANLSERWQQLRMDVLTKDSLMSRFTTTFNWLDSNGVYVREALAWKDYHFKNDEINHIGWWIDERLEFLDKYFIMDEDDVDVSIVENEIKNIAYIYMMMK